MFTDLQILTEWKYTKTLWTGHKDEFHCNTYWIAVLYRGTNNSMYTGYKLKTHSYCAGWGCRGAAVISWLVAVCVCCCIQRHGMLSHCPRARVVSRCVGMGCGILSREPILWWRGVLGWWERLGHGFRWSWGLLITLQGNIQIGTETRQS